MKEWVSEDEGLDGGGSMATTTDNSRKPDNFTGHISTQSRIYRSWARWFRFLFDKNQDVFIASHNILTNFGISGLLSIWL